MDKFCPLAIAHQKINFFGKGAVNFDQNLMIAHRFMLSKYNIKLYYQVGAPTRPLLPCNMPEGLLTAARAVAETMVSPESRRGLFRIHFLVMGLPA